MHQTGRKLKIVLTTMGTTGDVQPFLALGRRLREAGHAVRACSFDVHRERFEQQGIEFIPVGAPMDWNHIRRIMTEIANARRPWREVALFREFHLYEWRRHYSDCVGATAGQDLAICMAIHALGQAAVIHNGVPWIGVRIDTCAVPTAYAPPAPCPNLGMALNRVLWRAALAVLNRWEGRLHPTLSSIGADRPELSLFGGDSPHLNLLACSRHITRVCPDWPATYQITGPWLLTEPSYSPPPELERFLNRAPKPLVVTFGSMATGDEAQVARIITQAAKATGQRVVVQRGLAQLHGPSVADEVMFVDYVPHGYLFSRAALIVHHGGAGTTAAACYAGVPSIVVPHQGDQSHWAARLHELGVAPRPVRQRSLTTARLVDRIRTVLSSPEMAARAQAIAAGMRREDGLQEALRHIESFAATLDHGAR